MNVTAVVRQRARVTIRLWKVLVLSIGAGVMAALAISIVGYDPPDADIKYDWLSAKGAVTSNAYDDILALGQQEGVHVAIQLPHGVDGPSAHPRTPGAILFAIPLLLIEFDDLFAVSVGVTVALGILIVAFATEARDGWRSFGVLALFIVSAPFLTTIRFAGQSMLVAAVVLLAWVLYQSRHDLPAGLLVAFAGTLKLFPLLLLIPMLLQRRFRPVFFAASGVIVLNAVGLLLPGVSFGDWIEAMLQGADVWFRMVSNGSLSAGLASWAVAAWAGHLVAVALALAVVLWVNAHHRVRLTNDPMLWLTLGLLVLPISWISYDAVLLPALVYGLSSSRITDRYIVVGVWGIWIGLSAALAYEVLSDQLVATGALTVVARLLIIVGWLSAAIEWDWRRCRLATMTRGTTGGSISASSHPSGPVRWSRRAFVGLMERPTANRLRRHVDP